jgi:TP901 family phage tail tape measure protein
MTEIADLYVRLTANTAGFKAALAGAAAEGETFAGRMQRGLKGVAGFGVVAAAGLALIGAKAVDTASKFQRSMEQIHTLAGVPQSQIKGLSQSVLQLSGQVGYGPTSLSEALYHIESNFASVGLGGKKALDALRIAAEGAQIGHANLVDVTNALGAAIASGIGGVKDYSKAMGSLLSIVGSGDMQMQDLANAFSTGILAIAKQYGATLNDVGAALATFGDNNIRGQVAATDLRMAIMDLTKQGKPGVAALQSIGLASGQLGRDMQTGGMNKALIDLRNHLNTAGITGVKVGRFLEDAFTKKSSAPLAILMGQFDRLQSKYPELAKGANGFQAAWVAASAGVAIQTEKLKSRMEGFLTQLGLKLLPIATKAITGLNKAFDWLGKHTTTLKALGAAMAGVVATGLAMAAAAAWSFVTPFLLVAAPIAAVSAGLYVLYERSRTFRDAIGEIGDSFTKVVQSVSDGITLFKVGFSDWGKVITGHQSAWLEWGQKIRVVVDNVRSFLGAFGRAVVTTAQFLTHLWQTSSRFRGIIMAVGTAIALTVAPFLTLGAALVYVNQRWHIVGQVMTWFVHGPLAFVKQQIAVFQQFWAAHGQAILTIIRVVWTLISTYIKIEWAIISSILKVGLVTVQTMWKYSWDLIVNVVKLVWNTISAYIRTVIHVVLDSIGLFADLLTGKWGKLWGDVKKLVSDAFTGILGTVKAFAGGCLTLLYTAGKDLIQGLINGVKSMAGAAVGAVKGIGSSVVKGALDVFKINSPSKVFHQIGVGVGQGLVNGMASMHGHVANAGKAMASKAAHHAHAQITKAAAAAKHIATRAAVAAHKGIDQSISGVTTANTADRHRNAILSAFITDRRHHTKAGQAYARTLLGHDIAKDRAADVHARAVAASVNRNPHATAAERKRAGNAVTQADKILATAEKLRASIEKMTSSTSAAAKQSTVLNGRLITSHGRRLGARQAVLEDMPTYLAAMVHAGRAGTVTRRPYEGQPWRAPVTAGAMHFTVPVTVHVGAKKVHEEMQRHTIRHEGRNVNNGLSRHTSR